MYVIMAYDVNEKRVAKILKIGRKYLTWIQNSLLEGEITNAKFQKLKTEVNKVISKEEDSVAFYILSSENLLKKEFIGIRREPTNFL
ncbi:MAG: CRISPR-associated endonuclease Cas2 [Fervidobacterium sp.]|uniref:CRISPR-associated endonuclease Cas2 n=1 Tax=Fervidobacterium sp. TaxID=1871331 RepID=UPI00404A8AEB